ncbi:translation initiation factor eIF-2B [Gaopeijia maritima]|uniref:Uncharacterized protein n=1 Tax=Gaopeijia maritima TaxID=3119007 RepID=A0ABU9E5A1_9BACT
MFRLEALVSPLRADVVSGAAVISRTAADVVRRVAVRAPADDLDGFRSVLEETAAQILDAQPSLAPVVTLLSLALRAAADDIPLDEARREVARTAEVFRDDLLRRSERAGRHLADRIGDGDRIVTLSDSSTVRAGLLRAAERCDFSAVCLQSRPMNEGEGLARRLADAEVSVTFAVDAAMASVLPGCRAVVLGADSVGDRGIVNKLGSHPLSLAARAAGVPVWVVADGTKFLPPGFPQPLDDDRPAEEVGRPHPRARVWNRYFELLPFELVECLITEDGPLDPHAASARRSVLHLPPEIARWAARRAGRAHRRAAPDTPTT